MNTGDNPGQQPGWPHGGPQYGAPQGGPQYGYPPQQTPGAPIPPAGQPPVGAITTSAAAPEPPRKKNLPLLIIALVVVIALVAAGVVYLANRGSNVAAGAPTPEAAVENLLTALETSDPISIAEVIDPEETQQLIDVNEATMNELIRLEIFKPGTDASQSFGADITVADITYGDVHTMHDNLSVVEITGGTVTITTGASTELPFTDKISTLIPDGVVQESETETFDIAEVADETGNPLRIATIQRDGGWYPSLFYSIADNIAATEYGTDYSGSPFFTPIAARGASSAADAMTDLLHAAIDGNAQRLIELLAPGELGAVHDYANLFADGDLPTQWDSGTDIAVVDVQWITTPAVGARDGMKVSLQSLTLDGGDDGMLTISRDVAAGSITIKADGEPAMTFTGDDIIDLVQSALSAGIASFGFSMEWDGLDDGSWTEYGDDDIEWPNFDDDDWADMDGEFNPLAPEDNLGFDEIPAEVADMLGRVFTALLDTGVVMTPADDGQWYVSAVSSGSEFFLSLLQAIEPGDIDYFLSLADS